MVVFAILFLGLSTFVGAVICAFYALEPRRRRMEDQRRELDARLREMHGAQHQISARQEALDEEDARLRTFRTRLEAEAARLGALSSELEARLISYGELQEENTLLKRDLRNLDVKVRKLQLDEELRQEAQVSLDKRIKELGTRYLKENVKWISSSLNPNNFVNCKQRLQDVIRRCRGINLEISADTEAELIADLKAEYERVVRAALEREEQNRIKAIIREEQLREKEIERELKQLERERQAIKAALEKALAEAKDQHSEEVERLKARLAAAEESQRAISQAQLTKAGHVYVISNIGSFGEGVYKVGMTRRLEPLERIRELSSASVPFPFDVHMMITSEDAPTLETALHRELHKFRINKTNPRKEFFKVDLQTVYQIVKEYRGEVQYVADAEALEYRQSLAMSDDDQEFIESVYDDLEEETEAFADNV